MAYNSLHDLPSGHLSNCIFLHFILLPSMSYTVLLLVLIISHPTHSCLRAFALAVLFAWKYLHNLFLHIVQHSVPESLSQRDLSCLPYFFLCHSLSCYNCFILLQGICICAIYSLPPSLELNFYEVQNNQVCLMCSSPYPNI